MTAADDPKPSGADTTSADGGTAESPETAEQTIARLTQALADSTAEVERQRDLYLRERADVENFKKRMQREKADGVRFAVEPLVRDLLPVIDNLERAVDHAASGGNGQPLLEGVRLVLRNAIDALERHGITRIEATGAPFDPSRHEAIAQVADADVEPNRVVQQFLPGYTLHDRLLRPAQVSVSAKPSVESPRNDD